MGTFFLSLPFWNCSTGGTTICPRSQATLAIRPTGESSWATSAATPRRTGTRRSTTDAWRCFPSWASSRQRSLRARTASSSSASESGAARLVVPLQLSEADTGDPSASLLVACSSPGGYISGLGDAALVPPSHFRAPSVEVSYFEAPLGG